MTETLTTKLRFGWTTGTCATAAVNAAYTTMVTGTCPERVTIVTPIGKQANLEVSIVELGTGWVKAGIIKDAGDDPGEAETKENVDRVGASHVSDSRVRILLVFGGNHRGEGVGKRSSKGNEGDGGD